MDHPTVVLKVGTSSIIDTRTGAVQVAQLARIVEAIVFLTTHGIHAVLVSSGAVGLGCARLSLKSRPTSIAGKQAAASVGQVRLMNLYDDLFSVLGTVCSQVLLTYDAFGDRGQYLNARNTLLELLRMGAVPVVNENDTVAVQELRVGDNDTMSALVANMVGAQWLLLLTDVEALFTANPRTFPAAAPIRAVPTQAIQDLRKQMQAGKVPLEVAGVAGAAAASTAGGSPQGEVIAAPQAQSAGAAGSVWGTGGMVTKLKAAQLATAAGVTVLITNTSVVQEVCNVLGATLLPTLPTTFPSRGSPSRELSSAAATPSAAVTAAPSPSSSSSSSSSPSASHHAFIERGMGTTFLPAPRPVTGRKRWLLSLAPQGCLVLDAGAVEAITAQRKSLFPAGIVAVVGAFEAQDAVTLVSASDQQVELARALVNYSSEDCAKVKGRRSKDIAGVLGWIGAEAVADRDNIVLLREA